MVIICFEWKRGHPVGVSVFFVLSVINFLYQIVCFFAVSPYYKTKLKGLYTTAMQDAESETE